MWSYAFPRRSVGTREKAKGAGMEMIEEKTTVRELINRIGVLDPDRLVEVTIREPKDEAGGVGI